MSKRQTVRHVFGSPLDGSFDNLLLSGGFYPSAALFSSDTDTDTLGVRSLYACTDTSAPRVLTLSTADIEKGSPTNPWYFSVKDQSGGANANNITLASEDSQLFDGGATAVISEDFGFLNLYTDGANVYGR